MKDHKEENSITEYQFSILKPLDTFYTTHYKDIVQNGDTEVCKLLEKEYDLYLEKLENFCMLIENSHDNNKK